VKREWRDVVGTAKALEMYRTHVLGGGGDGLREEGGFTVIAMVNTGFAVSAEQRMIMGACLRWAAEKKMS